MRLILASSSPRRALLLNQVGIDYEIAVPDISEEIQAHLSPREQVVEIAEKKAYAVSGNFDCGIIMAADTVVVFEGLILGKPESPEDARQMLNLLSGNQHEVLTGIALLDSASNLLKTGLSSTRVWVKPMSEEEIDAYVATGEPLDKAGAYGIQGRAALYIDRIEGCYYNVVGLPLTLLYDLLKTMQH